MTIEAKIDELISALDRNTAAQTNQRPAEAPAKRGRPTKAESEAAAAPGILPVPSIVSGILPVPSVVSPPASPAAHSVQQIAAKVLELVSKTSRDVAVKLLAKHNAPRASDLKPEQYVAFYAEAQSLIDSHTVKAAKPGDDLV